MEWWRTAGGGHAVAVGESEELQRRPGVATSESNAADGDRVGVPGKRTLVESAPRRAALPTPQRESMPQSGGVPARPDREPFWQSVEQTYRQDEREGSSPFALRGLGNEQKAQPRVLDDANGREGVVPIAQSAQAAVERAPTARPHADATPVSPPSFATTTDQYVADNRANIIESLRDRLQETRLPAPHEGRLDWSAEGGAINAIAKAVERHIEHATL